MARFTGKVAIITGGGSGIGRATALLLAAEGAAVTVADIAPDAARTVVAEIEADGGTARAQETDVADASAVEAMVADTVSAFGGLDVLHNNAAALDQNRVDQDVVTMDLATWERVLAVNLTGPMLGCRFAIPALLERGGGAIVNTASAAAFYGSHSLAAYGTSKAGVVALTRYVATAYGERGIRCNAVAPGVVVDRKTQDALGGPMGGRLRRYSIESSRRAARLSRGDRPIGRLPGLRRRRVRDGRGAARRRRFHGALPHVCDRPRSRPRIGLLLHRFLRISHAPPRTVRLTASVRPKRKRFVEEVSNMRAIHKAGAALAVSGALILGGGVAAHAATNSSTTPSTSASSSGGSGASGASGAPGNMPAAGSHVKCPNM